MTRQKTLAFCNQSGFVPGISDDLFNLCCLWVTQHMRMECTWVGRLTLFLRSTGVMVINVHLQLGRSTAAQAFASFLQLQILEESIVHVLCSN